MAHSERILLGSGPWPSRNRTGLVLHFSRDIKESEPNSRSPQAFGVTHVFSFM